MRRRKLQPVVRASLRRRGPLAPLPGALAPDRPEWLRVDTILAMSRTHERQHRANGYRRCNHLRYLRGGPLCSCLELLGAQGQAIVCWPRPMPERPTPQLARVLDDGRWRVEPLN